MMAGSVAAFQARAARVGERRLHLRRDWADLKLSYRYRELLLRIHELERQIARMDGLGAAWRFPPTAGVAVKTCGACTPGSGHMLWYGSGHALVWFDGCDRPVVWPCANLETGEVAAE
jgi:hypothetical protein